MNAVQPEPAPATTRILRPREAREWLAAYRATVGNQLALLVIGIRDLKQINALHGRGQGDAAIRAVGVRIRRFASENAGSTQLIAKLPGREFLLAIRSEGNARKLEAIAKKLLDWLSEDLGEVGQSLHISARIGVAVSQPNESGSDLLHRASQALAQAYGRKGKKLAFAEDRTSTGEQFAAALDTSLRDAIERKEITIVLQPQFEVSTGRLIGAEALARWQHSELGEIGANELFASADRCDLREELSHLIQREAIDIAANWSPALNDLRLSVNLGAEELSDGYSEHLMDILHLSGFPPDRLTLELTEESLVRDIEQASVQLERLRAKKIRIAVDDFGTGYSSLLYLKSLPLDYLKLDKGMTPDISGTGKDRIVLRAIIAMGKALGLQIIAEGVEKEAELEMLKAEDCDFFQGYLRSPPLAAKAFADFALRSN
ncbi:MAG: GGDEF domain-containing phosphodiesterase [Sphingorhabdus sp.]